MNIKKDIREKLSKYLDKKLERGGPYIFNEAVNFIKKDRKEQLILHGVSHQRELLIAFSNYCNSFNIEMNNIDEDDVDAYLSNL